MKIIGRHRRKSVIEKPYQRNRAPIHLSNLQKRALRILVLVLSVVILFAVLFFSPLFHVQNVTVIRKSLSIDSQVIETFIQDHLREQTIQQKNWFLFSTNNLAKELQKEFPEWKSFEISKQFPNSVSVVVENFPVFASVQVNYLAEKNPEAEEGGLLGEVFVEETFAVNILGNVVEADIDEVPAYKIIYDNDYESVPRINASLINAQDMKFIVEVTDILLNQYDLVTKEIKYFKIGKEIHVNVFQYDLWFDLTQDLKTQLQKFRIALQETKGSGVEYFDLRIKNRVIYKEQNL